jgi:hypothetical protein
MHCCNIQKNKYKLTFDVGSTTPSTSKNKAPGIRDSCKEVKKEVGLLFSLTSYATPEKQNPERLRENLVLLKGVSFVSGHIP